MCPPSREADFSSTVRKNVCPVDRALYTHICRDSELEPSDYKVGVHS